MTRFLELALSCALAISIAGCDIAPELTVGPNETLSLTEDLNGDLACDRSVLAIQPGVSINGDIVARDCTLKIWSSPNGDIIATGGDLVSIQGARSVNGSLEIDGVRTVFVDDSSFNDDLAVTGSLDVTLADSHFNGDGLIGGGASVLAVGNTFNGNFEIRNTRDCIASNNQTNGDLSVRGCREPSAEP